jgi:trk system potassium uptake protein TrkH
MRALLANMGFVLQISGVFILIPIIASFVFNETVATIGLLLTAIAFLIMGFMMNSLCEKKSLSFKQSSTLIVLVFVILSLVGAIPYFYVNTGTNLLQSATDSIFESTSGFTTTGFSVIPDLSALPRSIILYRGLTQFVGGVGIVLVLLAFFYPEAKLQDFARSMGLSKNQKIKKAFLLIVGVYATATAIMVLAGWLLGYKDIINLAAVIFSAISTGGFSPVADMTQMATQTPLNYILLISMILGSCNFLVLAGLFKAKIKEFFDSEISVFFIMATLSIAAIVYFFKFSVYDATFNVISAMSTTGFSYLPIQTFPDTLKLLMVFLMFVGGASFSTAGGIKIFRFVLMFKAAKKAVSETVTEKDDGNVKLFGREYTSAEVLQSAVLVLLAIAIIFVSSLVISNYGFRPIDAIFESTAALATTGLSTGIVNFSLAIELKWLFIFLMLLGRVEIFAFLVIFYQEKKRPKQCEKPKTQKNDKNHEPEAEKETEEITEAEEAKETEEITEAEEAKETEEKITVAEPAS